MNNKIFQNGIPSAMLLLVLLSLPMTREAFSQEEEDKEKAKEYFLQGVTYYEQGDYNKAIEEFDKAFEQYPAFKILFNRGMCYLKLDMLPQAATDFSDAVAISDDSTSGSALDKVKGHLADLKKKLGTIRLTGQYENSELTIDGKINERGTKGKDIFLNPGLHAVIIVKNDKKIIEKSMSIQADVLVEIFVSEDIAQETAVKTAKEEGKEEEKAVEKAEEKETPLDYKLETTKAEKKDKEGKKKPMSGLRTGAWITFGIGVAGLLTAALCGGFALSEESKYQDAENEYLDNFDTLPQSELDMIEQRLDDHYDTMMNLAHASTAMFVIGGLSAFTSIVLFPLDIRRSKEKRNASVSLHWDVQSLGLSMTF